MAERETVHVWACRHDADVSVYAKSWDCLDAARDLARVIGPGAVIHMTLDDGRFWFGHTRAAVPPIGTGEGSK